MAVAKGPELTELAGRVNENVPARHWFPRGWLERVVTENNVGACNVVTDAGRLVTAVNFGGEVAARLTVRPDGQGDSGLPVYKVLSLQTDREVAPNPTQLANG